MLPSDPSSAEVLSKSMKILKTNKTGEMMRYLLMMLMVITTTQVTASGVYDIIESLAERAEQATTTSEVEVVEIFKAESPEELEAALTDGYPMPWLEEILNDESIPEEDRYWRDCRVRAVYAQDLHLFFNEEGNPVHVEADWIKPAEGYWRETFLVASPDRVSHSYQVDFGGSFGGRPGIIVGSYGDRIGEIAISGLLLSGSKDGSLFATSINQISDYSYRLILFYPDGSYHVSPIEMSYGRCGISQSGEYVILAARGKDDPWGDDDIPPRAILLDKSGIIVWETELEMTPIGNPTPVISPDDRYCAVVTQASSAEDRLNHLLQVFDMETGQEVWRIENPPGAELIFSNNGRILNISGLKAISLDITTGQLIWTDNLIDRENYPIAYLMHLDCSDQGLIYSGAVWPSSRSDSQSVLNSLFNQSGNVLASDNIDGSMDISPNGYFVLSENYQPETDRTTSPIIVRRIIRVGE